MNKPLLRLEVRLEHDIVLARQRARQIADLLDFEVQDQTRIATAVSEIARNALQYGGGGMVEFLVDAQLPPAFLIRISDQGPGIGDLPSILDGRYVSSTGMGVGIVGARRLMDRFAIESVPGVRTTVLLGKNLPRNAPVLTPAHLARVAEELARRMPHDPFAEVRQQNQELMQALEELGHRQEQLTQVNRELEDTNRGVVALYAELDEKADYLKRASEMKSTFLSNMSHEFRTPLNSILSLARILLDRIDGALTMEQEKQVKFHPQGRRGAHHPNSSTTCSTWPRSKPAKSSFGRRSSRHRPCSARCAGCCVLCWPTTTLSAWCSRNRGRVLERVLHVR